jgi:hypothetical protein
MGTLDRNNSAIMAALAAAGITSVVVTFDGSGDNGQIESLEARAGETMVELPANVVVMVDADNKDTIPSDEDAAESNGDTSLAEAIEQLCYNLLEQEHDGWEINEGAYGTFTFNVLDRSVELDFTQRIVDEENSLHRF